MEQDQYALMFQQEELHWWYVGNRTIIASLLDKFLPKRLLRILDAGCGTGKNLQFLSKYGAVSGVDMNDVAIQCCKERGFSNIQKASVEDLPFESNTFDLITSFEVLYHQDVHDWHAAVREAYRVCDSNGLFLIRVPAFKILWGGHDVVVHGARRFRRKELVTAMQDVGFEVVKASYANMFMFIPVLFVRSLQRLFNAKAKADIESTNKFWSSILLKLLLLEAVLMKKINLPFGVSVIVIGKKS